MTTIDLFDTPVLREREHKIFLALRRGPAKLGILSARAPLSLGEAKLALAALADHGLVERPQHTSGRWQLSAAGSRAEPLVERARSTQPVEIHPGSAADRFLRLLVIPMPLRALHPSIGVSPQRLREILFKLLAAGLVRTADPEHPQRFVARADDPTPLFTRDVERVLTSLDTDRPADIDAIAAAAGETVETVAAGLDRLVAAGLVEMRVSAFGDLFTVTKVGQSHPQWCPGRRIAAPPSLPVRSRRVREVLLVLAVHGPTRTAEIGRVLGIGKTAINALMQYLKRKGLVEKTGAAVTLPHRITQRGRDVLAELQHRGPATELAENVAIDLSRIAQERQARLSGARERRTAARRLSRSAPDEAKASRLPVRSSRTFDVLRHLDAAGPMRTIAVGRSLGIPAPSMNALMQHLKRLGLVEKAGAATIAPHRITTQGRAVLAAHERGRSPAADDPGANGEVIVTARHASR